MASFIGSDFYCVTEIEENPNPSPDSCLKLMTNIRRILSFGFLNTTCRSIENIMEYKMKSHMSWKIEIKIVRKYKEMISF